MGSVPVGADLFGSISKCTTAVLQQGRYADIRAKIQHQNQYRGLAGLDSECRSRIYVR